MLHTVHIDVPSNSPHTISNHERSLKVNEKYRLVYIQRASERLYTKRIWQKQRVKNVVHAEL